ncbi:MAG: B12-binding domain-containing radical SAM protein [Nitrospirae bacterium]|nr:B12-binding domain-containing radical SAM protein [Nitrospirota bacterium]
MKNILLVNPNYRLEIRWVASEEDIDVKADYLPLGLATVAALIPEGFQVDIWDELVRGRIDESVLERTYDLVGVTSHSANLGRALEIGNYFREKGCLVVVGGPGVTSNPDKCRSHFNVLFIGEAELTWPRFLREWSAGSQRTEYRQIERPDIAISPMPKWDSVVTDVKRYAMGTVQTTRGCPNDCEFCDVVYLNGLRQRHKSVDRILEEVRALQRLGVKSISFNDDNFTIDHEWAKKVLRSLIPMNNAFPAPLRFMTQLSIDVARDDELLALLADANFYQVLIGIESPNKESLRETGKFGNLRGDLVTELHKVLSYGIVVRGAMIVGFDHDDKTIFDMQYNFISDAYLPSISMHMLNAPIGTRLWRRLRGEGRVIDAFSIADKSTQRLFNNTIPKLMTRVELMQGFRELYERLFSWGCFKERMLGFISLANRPFNFPQKEEPLEKLLNLGPGLKLDREACDAMAEIFTNAHQRAPYLMGRVKELVIQFVRYRESVHDFLPGLDKQIEHESSGKITIKLDNRPVTVPQGFRETYPKIFPEIHKRAYLNLKDKQAAPEALVEVLVEFLVHEEGLARLEEHHIPELYEIVDRTCARFNGEKHNGDRRADADVEVPDPLRTRLHDDILKSVEQELFKLVQAKKNGAV